MRFDGVFRISNFKGTKNTKRYKMAQYCYWAIDKSQNCKISYESNSWWNFADFLNFIFLRVRKDSNVQNGITLKISCSGQNKVGFLQIFALRVQKVLKWQRRTWRSIRIRTSKFSKSFTLLWRGLRYEKISELLI